MTNFYRYLTIILVAVGSVMGARSYGDEIHIPGLHDANIDNILDSPIEKFIYYETLGISLSYRDEELSNKAYKKAEEYLDHLPVELLLRHILNAQIYANLDNSFKMISAIDRAIYIYNCLVKDNPRILTELLYLKGKYYTTIDDYDKALRYLNAALQQATQLVDNQPLIIRICAEIVQVSKNNSNYELRRSVVEALLRLTSTLPSESPQRLEALYEVIDFYLDTHNAPDARKYLTEYFKARPDGMETLHFTVRLGILMRDYDSAKTLIEYIEKDGEPERTKVNDLWEEFYDQWKQPEIAVYARRNLEIYRKELASRLLFMSSEERHNISKELVKKRDKAISLAVEIPEMTEVALDYSLLVKGLLFTTETNVRAFMKNTAQADSTLDTVINLRKHLYRAEAAGEKEIAERLRSEIASRERYMISDYMDFNRLTKEMEKHSLKYILTHADKESAFVDFVGCRDGKYYVAFVIDGDSKKVSLKTISSRYKLNRMPYGTWLLLDTLLNGKKDVYFSTDGILSSKPLEFLLDSEGKPYSDRYRLHRVFHLADINHTACPGDKLTAIGVSDHNSPVGKGETLHRGSWTDLANVKEEMDIIRHHMKSKKLNIMFNDDARESEVKKLDGTDVSILHISTHGFYKNMETLQNAVDLEDSTDYSIALRALEVGKKELSGLVLRQGNLSWKSPEILDEEDDLLTTEEIELMSFPNLQLTVLSACDTGLGATDSEGVWGLQRAFRIAGTKNLICTLSEVDDYWSAQFMDLFYEQLGKGAAIYDAFHNAQKTLREENPDNPEIWTSFILIE